MSVECFHLTKKYGAKTALNDVSLKISDGGVTGLVGPNGAGKSTFIKLVTGLLWPTEGGVLVDGFDVHRRHAAAMRRLGAVIEWPSFHTDLTARMNLRILSGGYGAAYEAKVGEIAKQLEIDGVLDTKVSVFSTGMRQRLGIALALLPDSKFIILDEPTNGLDPGGIVEIREIIRTCSRNAGVTVLVSSHLLSEIEQVCDNLVLISGGEIKACGRLGELLGGGMTVKIGTPAPEQALELLRRREPAVQVARNGDTLELHSEGVLDPAGLNTLLVSNGIPVSRLESGRRNLEDFYLSKTQGDAR